MKASRLFMAGSVAALLPLAAALAQQSPTPNADTRPTDPASQSAPAATPPAATPPAATQGGGATFESLDVNGDGKISLAEAEANAGVKAQFSRYDVNGDGFIERDEVSAANKPPADTPQQ
jgi:hypothetical protein